MCPSEINLLTGWLPI